MMPGIDPRMMKRAMKQLGIKQEDIDASQVIIKTPGRDIVINNPSVAKVNMMGQETFQISGNIEEVAQEEEQQISEDDIETVMSQAKVDRNTAESAIRQNNGDLAAAIMQISRDK